MEQLKQKNTKNAEYFKTLQPGAIVNLFIPYNYDDKKVTGTVIENDGNFIILESWFDNTKRIGRRKFRVKDGRSSGPAYFASEDYDKKPVWYYMLTPEEVAAAEKKPDKRTIPEPINIPTIGEKPRTHDEDGDLIF